MASDYISTSLNPHELKKTGERFSPDLCRQFSGIVDDKTGFLITLIMSEEVHFKFSCYVSK